MVNNEYLFNNKNDIKNFLKEVKNDLDSKSFKQFINDIKLITDKNYSQRTKENIIEDIKMLLIKNNDLYIKFESIVKNK